MRKPHCTIRSKESRGACAAVVLLGVVACAEEERSYLTCLDSEVAVVAPPANVPLVHQTEHLDIYVEDGRFVCAGTAAEYERFVEYVAEELDMQIQRRIPFYMLEAPPSYCTGHPGCTTPNGTVFTTPVAAYHELAHGVACEIRANSARALTEGLAVSFEPAPNDSMADPRSYLVLTGDEFDPNYDRAGHFARWLLEEFGPSAFKEAYRTAPLNAGDDVLRVLEDTMGMSIDMLSSEYLARAPLEWMPHRQCEDLAPLPWSGDSWVIDARFDCDEASTLGPNQRGSALEVAIFGADKMYQSFELEVETAGSYLLERSDLETVHFEKCVDGPTDSWRHVPVFFTLQGTSVVELDPGRWRVDVLVDHGPATDVWVTIVPPG